MGMNSQFQYVGNTCSRKSIALSNFVNLHDFLLQAYFPISNMAIQWTSQGWDVVTINLSTCKEAIKCPPHSDFQILPSIAFSLPDS